jgi:hypothetical protein
MILFVIAVLSVVIVYRRKLLCKIDEKHRVCAFGWNLLKRGKK